ncbi:RNA polymerase subunit sigma-70 [Kitasatospora sp. SUK 42]|nr:RNA polymerase subunit sigma-70 [Kitasatospora sp. SUK 42]
MPDHDRPEERFGLIRPHLRALAYRLLGSHADSEDAVLEAWIRLGRINPEEVDDLPAWLTTVTGRVCLSLLRARAARPGGPVGVHLPDVVVEPEPPHDREGRTAPSDQVGLALLVALDALAPAERVAFVLHDLCRQPVDRIATVLEQPTAATRKLVEQGRRRVREAREADSEPGFATRRRLVEAFFAAARDGDPDGLAALLDPEAELRADGGTALPAATAAIRGARGVAEHAASLGRGGPTVTAVLVNGAPGALVSRYGVPVAVAGFAVRAGRITRIQLLLDPRRLAPVGFAAFTA